jgi:hypothetical protein
LRRRSCRKSAPCGPAAVDLWWRQFRRSAAAALHKRVLVFSARSHTLTFFGTGAHMMTWGQFHFSRPHAFPVANYNTRAETAKPTFDSLTLTQTCISKKNEGGSCWVWTLVCGHAISSPLSDASSYTYKEYPQNTGRGYKHLQSVNLHASVEYNYEESFKSNKNLRSIFGTYLNKN